MKFIISIIFYVSLLLATNLNGGIDPFPNNETKLIVGMELDRTISSVEKHLYTVELKNGMAIIAEIEQLGVDLVIKVIAPNGQEFKEIDSPNGKYGREPIDITANESGIYQLIVSSLNQEEEKGNYHLKVEQILPLEENIKRIAKKELPTQTLYDLWGSLRNGERSVEDFMNSLEQKHIIEPIEGNDLEMLVTYFCTPDADTEYVLQSGGPDFLGLRFQRLGNTQLFFTTQVVPNDARFNYGFNYFNLYQSGPNGEVKTRDVVHAYDGTVQMPNAPQQNYIIKREGIPEGNIIPLTIESKYLKEDRKITIYTPPNYNAKIPHNLLIVFDGESYGARPNRNARIPCPIILDNLAADDKITPTIAVLVWNMGKRRQDLISKDFADFVGEELIRWVRGNYKIHSGAGKVIVAGASRGGFAASHIALNYPKTIGNVLSQSGSYWIKGTKDENHWVYPKDTGKLIKAFKEKERLPIKFYMEIGLFDAGASMLGMNRELRDILEVKGYDVDYREFNGGHSYVNWRGSFSDGLISLIGKE